MCKIKRLPYIHIILIYFTFIYTHHTDHSFSGQTHASEVVTDTTLPTTELNSDIFYDDDTKTDELTQAVKDSFKNIAKERLFKIKGNPTTGSNTKFYVPRAMLEKYREYRDIVREVIPNDREFYGKIPVEDLDGPEEDFWSAVYNKFGSYDIQIDMGSKDEDLEDRKFNYKGDASHIAHIPPGREPEDVPPNIEPLLPPHSRSVQSQRQFISVHLHFNLSQEVYASPTAAEDLKGAELHLAREKLHNCELERCERKPVPFFKKNQTSSSTQQNENSDTFENERNSDLESEASNRLHNVPRYQRLYILQVNGYDEFNEPKARIFTSKRIDTRYTTPVVFNIYPIVKNWLEDPDSNHGIIVRVTNDDPAYEHASKMSKVVKNIRLSQTSKRELNITSSNATSINMDSFTPTFGEAKVVEHVRLKRGFRSASDNEDTWLRNQPSILIYSKPAESEKHHVKRDNEKHEDDTDGMQADDPDASSTNYRQTITPTSSLNVGGLLPPTDGSLNVAKQSDKRSDIGAHQQTRPNASVGRRSQQNNRGSGTARSSNQQGGSKPKPKPKPKPPSKQAEKCSKKSLAINFDEVGWSSWIIAPHSYYANYCSGECVWPLSDSQNATNHAIIQAIYHQVSYVIQKSCCAPVKLGRMAILYQLDGIVQMRHYDDMIVEACGCL